MKITREAKIYPNKTQEKNLINLFEKSRLFYNSVLERKISHYKKTGKNLSRFNLQKEFKGKNKEIPASLRQTLIYRVNNAFQFFFNKHTRFPRFKGKNRFRSIELRQYGGDYRIDGRKLSIWKIIGKMKMRGFCGGEPIGMGRIVKRVSGWYFQYPVEIKEKKAIKSFRKKVGIDLGIKSFVADSNKNIEKYPRFFSLSQEKLANLQKNKSKKVGRLYEKISNQRKDWLHKLSRKYADKYDFIAVEDLNIKNMVRNKLLAKYISDASWGTFIQMLSYKMKILGKKLVKVNPSFTSQKCLCGANVTKSLSVRTHICPECGLIEDRDIVSAKLILKKAWDEPSKKLACQ